jgi:hypothetical protein
VRDSILVCSYLHSDVHMLLCLLMRVHGPRYKSVTKYMCDFSRCNDIVRCTVVVAKLADVTSVVSALLDSARVVVVRIKNRFADGYDAKPSGGYLDCQLLVVFNDGNGRWQFGEVQVNLEQMVAIKERAGGGHSVFKFARSLAAFDAKTFTYSGRWSESVSQQIASGVLLEVDLLNGRLREDGAAAKLAVSLSSPKCRVTSIK